MTNSALKWAGWFLLCVILQSTLVPQIAIMSVKPDLLLVVLFYFSVRMGMMPGTFVGFFIGLGQDIFSPDMLGQNALAKSISGFVLGLFNERVVRLDPVMRGALLVAAFILNDTVIMLIHIIKVDGGAGAVLTELLVVTLPRAIYSLVFAALPFVWANVAAPRRLVD